MPDELRETTSLKIRPSLWKRVKIASIQRDLELSVFVEQILEEYLKKTTK